MGRENPPLIFFFFLFSVPLKSQSIHAVLRLIPVIELVLIRLVDNLQQVLEVEQELRRNVELPADEPMGGCARR